MLTFNNKIITRNDKWVSHTYIPPEPVVLPPYTIRLLYKPGITPTFNKGTGRQVSTNPNIWDLTYENTDWTSLVASHTDLLEVIAANTSNVTDMTTMFYHCSSLRSVALFDTSNVNEMMSMFNNCTSLTDVPLFNLSHVNRIWYMFQGCSALTYIPAFNIPFVYNMTSAFEDCINVQYGALAIYQQAAAKDPQPTHIYTFTNCGSNTTTGAAELAQIPWNWKRPRQ